MALEGILILGAAGFVGSCLLKRMECKNAEVYGVSTKVRESKYISHVKLYKASLDDTLVLNEILPRCKTVVYLASHSNPGFSALRPSVEAESNLLPCLRFLEVLQKYNDIRLIYISSGGTVYGNASEEYISEKMALAPVSYYGAGKAAMEKFILAYCTQAGGNALILRPTNFYGPEQPYKAGFGIIPTIFNCLQTQTPLKIWGDGEAVRDYLFIDDFLDLCEQLIEKKDWQVGRRRIYNVGAEKGTSINELCRIVEDVTGQAIEKKYEKEREVDVQRSVLDCRRIQKDFNWKAGTSLQEGIRKSWQWYQKTQK